MPRQKPHRDAHIPNPAVSSAPHPDALPPEPLGSTWAYATGTAREHTALAALHVLCVRNDGWLRVVPHEDGGLVYAKWKFTSRRWPNHYVMFRCADEDYVSMLWGLIRKIEAVDAGLVKPVYDHPYSNA